jgi:patatin-related protein
MATGAVASITMVKSMKRLMAAPNVPLFPSLPPAKAGNLVLDNPPPALESVSRRLQTDVLDKNSIRNDRMPQSNTDVCQTTSSAKSEVVAKEIRFSVVMYGGVSLAVYMNGVTQELLHMVRSTARGGWDNKPGTRFRLVAASDASPNGYNSLKSTEAIYRKLAYELNDSEVDDVRFIIDVISGTSAGGINGIFLAKALTDDSLDLDTLQSLWIDYGGFDNLLNDKQTRRQAHLPASELPKSLLCSDRMYFELLEAFRSMNSDQPSGREPLCREMDLFVTTTDINGRVIPLRLADMLVWERRYKQDFHLRFSKRHKRNDFEGKNNPFLAFIARCTSSFPFAFEPMQLSKLKELRLTKAWPDDVDVNDELLDEWEHHFFDNSEQVFTGLNLTRPFGDGGYLNNKPFSYAIDMLGRHSAEFPTERKLIYVEPSPEHPEIGTGPGAQARVPGPIMNSYDALIKLPGYQPIHDDLQRVTERNRLVRKVAELSAAVTAKIYVSSESESAERGDRRGVTAVDPRCVGDFSYLVLRVYATTDEIASLMTQWFGFTKSSSYYYGLRCIVRAWREATYEGYGDGRRSRDEAAEQYLKFLDGFDLDFEKRKYLFIREQINMFYCCDAPARAKLRAGFNIVLNDTERKDFQQALIALKGPFDDAYEAISDTIQKLEPDPEKSSALVLGPLKVAAEALICAAHEFQCGNRSWSLERDEAADESNAAGINISSRRTSKSSTRVPESGKSIVEFVLGIQRQAGHKPTPIPAEFDESYAARARRVYSDDPLIGVAIRQFAAVLSSAIISAGANAAELAVNRLAIIKGTLQAPGAKQAVKVVEFFHRRAGVFDAAIFPMIYNTGVGTAELISIIRVSPDDCTSLFDHPGTQKLAGASLAHFGAFLDRSFRTNDILWGRLDGAERIIRALLAGTQRTFAQRQERGDALIHEAHTIIISEYLTDRRQELAGVLHEVAKSLKPPVTDPSQQAAAVRECVAATLDALPQQALKDAVNGFLTVDRIREYLSRLPVKREPDHRTTLESIARTIRVVGGMLQGLGDETKPAGGFLVRVAIALWWLVEAAVPRGLMGDVFRKFFAMLTWFAIVMIVAGTFLDHAVQAIGFDLLGVTLILWLVKDGLERFLLHGRRGPRVTGLLAFLVVLAFGGLVAFMRYTVNPNLPLIHILP